MSIPAVFSEFSGGLSAFSASFKDLPVFLNLDGPVYSVGYPENWYFLFIFLDLVLFAWIRLSFGVSFERTLEASFNFQTAVRMFNDNSQLQRQLDSLLYFFYFINVAFLLLIIEGHFRLFPFGQEGLLLFLINLAGLIVYFFTRAALVRIAAYLFDRVNLVREYSYHVSNYNKIAGIVIAPFLLLLIYTPEYIRKHLFWIIIALLISIFILRIIRGLIFSWKRNIFIFYMFLYLCALEIVPLLLLFKWTETVI